MNKIILLIISSIFIFSCNKTSINTRNDEPINFEILGLSDTTIYQSDTVEYNVAVNYLSGNKEKVVLFVSNLPVTMSAGLYPDIDTPSYNATIRLVAHNADTGAYNITIGASSSTVTKNYNVKVRVIPTPVNPAAILVGNYEENGQCTVSNTIKDTVSVSTINPYFNKIKITGLWTGSSSINVNADIDPVSHTINIPFQQTGNQYLSGTGSYNNNIMTINYVVTDGALFSDNCTTVLTKF